MNNSWRLVLRTTRYSYWAIVIENKVVYQVTQNDQPPPEDCGGYFSLQHLRKLKSDEDS